MDYKLPEKFELIIVGTGMVESVLSAAASRIGKKVLQVDRNDYYGGQWASFNLEALQKLAKNKDSLQADPNIEPSVNSDEELKSFGNNLFNIIDFTFRWHIPKSKEIKIPDEELKAEPNESGDTEDKPEDELVWTRDSVQELSRKFNIDLAPKIQYARGDLVELLISSNIARYSEYRSVSRVLVWLNGQLEVVPCSRSDVFSNNKVSVIEKRMLMKLLTSLDNEVEELKRYENKTFHEFLKDKKLTPNLVHYVLYAISMSNSKTSCQEGINNTKRFINSLGRFGKTPFLFSMYGSGDITQAFCRLSAVFGGIFALGQPLRGFSIKDDKCESIIVDQQTIQTDHLVISVEYAPEKYVGSAKKKYISRGILITDKSVMESEKEHLTLLVYPPEGSKNSVTIMEMGPLTGTCPKDLYLVHLVSSQVESPEEDFKHVVNNLFITNPDETPYSSKEKPVVICSCYFSLPDSNDAEFSDTPGNVILCPGPDSDLDYDVSIRKAKEIFERIYPDLEFLPRAPDPEEIVIEGEDEQSE